MKRNFFPHLLAIFFPMVISTPSIAEPNLNGGWYVGFQAGKQVLNINDHLYLCDDDTDITTMNPTLSLQNWFPGLFMGFGHYFNDRFYLGGEVFANRIHGSSSYQYQSISRSAIDIDYFTINYQVNNNYGVSILPGLKLTPTLMIYARLGWNTLQFKAQQTLVSDADTSVYHNQITIPFSKSTQTSGMNYGIGIESLIYKNISIRGEYSETQYNSINSYSFFTTKLGSNFAPRDYRVSLGIIYHFA